LSSQVKSSQVKSSQVKSLESDVVVARLSCVSLGNLAGGSTPAPAACRPRRVIDQVEGWRPARPLQPEASRVAFGGCVRRPGSSRGGNMDPGCGGSEQFPPHRERNFSIDRRQCICRNLESFTFGSSVIRANPTPPVAPLSKKHSSTTMREVISIHLGQCGVQCGNACWELYCLVRARALEPIARDPRASPRWPAPPARANAPPPT